MAQMEGGLRHVAVPGSFLGMGMSCKTTGRNLISDGNVWTCAGTFRISITLL
jgi:hypothetical protein